MTFAFAVGSACTAAVSRDQRAKYEATGTRPAAGGKSEWTPSKQEYKLAMSYTEHRKGLSETQRLRAYHDEVLKPAGLGRAS